MPKRSSWSDRDRFIIAKEWMAEPLSSARIVAARLAHGASLPPRPGRLSRTITPKELKALVRLWPLNERGIMEAAEVEEVRQRIAYGVRKREGFDVTMAGCLDIRQRRGWTPTSKISGRMTRIAAMQSQGHVSDAMTGKVENVMAFFAASDILLDPLPDDHSDTDRRLADERASDRVQAAQRVHDLCEGAALSLMGSANLDAIPAGFGATTPSDHKTDCMIAKGRLKRAVAPHEWSLLERTIWQDVVTWDGPDGDVVLAAVRSALDDVAVAAGISSPIARKAA